MTSSGIERQLRDAAAVLDGFEIVPGLPISAPQFGPAWPAEDVLALRELVGGIPGPFAGLLRELGGVSAIEAGGGFASMDLAAIRRELSLEYGSALARLDDGGTQLDVLPIGTNSTGTYLLLACDDSGVWKFNVHMGPVARPEKVAESTADFFAKLATEWRAMAAGKGGPYVTE